MTKIPYPPRDCPIHKRPMILLYHFYVCDICEPPKFNSKPINSRLAYLLHFFDAKPGTTIVETPNSTIVDNPQASGKTILDRMIYDSDVAFSVSDARHCLHVRKNIFSSQMIGSWYDMTDMEMDTLNEAAFYIPDFKEELHNKHGYGVEIDFYIFLQIYRDK